MSQGNTDAMSLIQFEDELRRVARLDNTAPVADPLGAAVQKVTMNPAFAQSRLLSRVLRALAEQRGEFRRAETAAFDTATLRIVIALMNAARDGTSTRDQWAGAVAAAESSAGG